MASDLDDERTLNMPTKQFSLDDPAEGRDNDFHADTLSDDVTTPPDELLMVTTLMEDIESALSSLNPREEDILKRYYGLGGSEPHTLEEIGRHYRLTRERVRQIRDRAIWRLRNSPQRELLLEHSNN